ncbi:MAG: BatD family protein, partial [Candidatus Omnitrophota bacterium]
MKRIVALTSIGVFLLVASACAGDIQLEATVDRTTVSLGEALQLELSFHGTQNISAPTLNKIDGFDARYLGPSTMVSIVNGAVTSSITHIYTLIPLKTGTFTLGPFSADAQGTTLTSKPITVTVLSSPPAGRQPSASAPDPSEQSSQKVNPEELKDRIFLAVSALKRKVYVNESTSLTIKLYVNRLAARDIQFPVLETNDFSIEKFAQPKQYREELGGVLYDVIEFSAPMFALKPGECTLGPAKLKCNLAVRRQNQRRRGPFNDDLFGGLGAFDDFFGGYEVSPLEVKSAAVPVTVLPLPPEGKPDGFDGTLGDFQLSVEATPVQVKAGDPITLKMSIRGAGNFESVKVPRLIPQDGFKIYDPQVKQGENEKVFEQVIIPDSEKITATPQVRFAFFNTRTGQYEILTNAPIPITVAKAQETQTKLIESPTFQAPVKPTQKEELGRDIIYLKDSPGTMRRAGRYLYQSLWFWLVHAVSFLLFITMVLLRRWKQRLKDDTRYARRLRAPAKAKKGIREIGALLPAEKADAFFDAVIKTMKEYLADRF